MSSWRRRTALLAFGLAVAVVVALVASGPRRLSAPARAPRAESFLSAASGATFRAGQMASVIEREADDAQLSAADCRELARILAGGAKLAQDCGCPPTISLVLQLESGARASLDVVHGKLLRCGDGGAVEQLAAPVQAELRQWLVGLTAASR